MNMIGEIFIINIIIFATFAEALSRANRGRLPPLLSPLAHCTESGALSKPTLTDPVQGLQEMAGLQRHPQRTPDNKEELALILPTCLINC